MARSWSPIKRASARAALLAVACVVAPASLAQAATIPVTTQFDTSSNDGQCSLREAIGAQALDTPSGSAAGECPAGDDGHDTITLPAGLYPLSTTLNFFGHLTITGAGATQTIISEGGGNRVMYLQDISYPTNPSDLTLDGVTLTGGHALDGGTGSDVFGTNGNPGGFPGQPATGNGGSFADSGGAIYDDMLGSLTIVNSRITGNSAGDGGDGGRGSGGDGGAGVGAGSCAAGATGSGGPGSPGGDGGAIYSWGPLVIRDSVISGNSAGTGGDGGPGYGGSGGVGGASFQQGCAGATGTGGAGGAGGSGGAIYAHASVTVEHTLITGNQSGSGGTGGEGDGGQGATGGSAGGTGGEGGDGNGGAGGAGGGGAVVATGSASVTVVASTFSDNGAGAGGLGGAGLGSIGGDGGGTTGIGWFGGEGQGGAGGDGGSGGAIRGGTGTLSVSASSLAGNVAGAGGDGGHGGGGQGGDGRPSNGHAGDGSQGTGGHGGDGGRGGGIFTASTSQLTNATVTQNRGGAGGSGGSGGGGSGGNAPANQGGYGGPGYGGTGGNGGGGGIQDGAGTLTILHATVSSNQAGSAGGGGGAFGGGAGSGTTGNPQPGTGTPGAAGAAGGGGIQTGGATVSLANSVLAQNTPANCTGPVDDGFHNIRFGDETCPGTTADPRLAALADNGGPTSTQALGAGSAAREAVPASGAGCALTDQRGVSRPRFGDCDAGAFEQSPPDVSTGAATGVSSSGATLTGAVTPNAASASYRFEYGTTSDYGATTDARDLPGGVTPAAVSIDVGSLAPSATYHYRLVAATGDGTAAGTDQSFTTGAAPGGPTGRAATDKTPPAVKLLLTRQKLLKALKNGYFAFFSDNERGNATADLFATGKTAKGTAAAKRKRVAHGTLKVTKTGKQKLVVKFTRKAKKAFKKRKKVTLTLVLTVKDAAGNATKKTAKVTLKR